MLSDNPIQKCRDIINRTGNSLRKEAPQAWGKLLRDEQEGALHLANVRRENKYCQQIHNEIYMRASAEKREPTDSEFEAMQCLENIIDLHNRMLQCNGQLKPDTFLDSLSIKIPLKLQRGLIAQF